MVVRVIAQTAKIITARYVQSTNEPELWECDLNSVGEGKTTNDISRLTVY